MVFDSSSAGTDTFLPHRRWARIEKTLVGFASSIAVIMPRFRKALNPFSTNVPSSVEDQSLQPILSRQR